MEFTDGQICRAIDENNAERVSDYISLGLNINRVILDCENSNLSGLTLLNYAMAERAFDVIRVLIKHNCQVDKVVKVNNNGRARTVTIRKFKNKLEYTPLYRAICTGNTELVNLFIGAGSDVNMYDQSACSALWHAVDANLYDVTDAITKVPKCDVNAHDKFKMTPLHVAIVHQCIDIAKLLLDRGALIQQRQLSGGSSLLLACGYKNTDLVHLLLKHGSDPNLSDNEGITPLVKSLNVMKNIDTVFLLCNAGAHIYTKSLWRSYFGKGRLILTDTNVRTFLLDNLDQPSSLKLQATLAIKESMRQRSKGKSIYQAFTRLPLPKVLIKYLQLEL